MKKNKVKFLILIILLFICIFFRICKKYSYILELKLHWNINLPIATKIIYSANSGSSFNGDGANYAILYYSNTKRLEKKFNWKKSISDSDINNFEKKLELINNIDNEKIVDFSNSDNLYYIIVGDDQMSTLFLVYNKSEKKLYYLEVLV